MELCSKSLKDWLGIERNVFDYIPIPQTNIFRDLIDGLCYLHGLNIIHRDIKPGNIMVNDVNSDPRSIKVKFGDFGLSRTIQEGDEYLTNHVGTTSYAAPESMSHEYDFRSDVYSLGLVVIVLFCDQKDQKSALNAARKEKLPLLLETCFNVIAKIVKKNDLHQP